MALFVQIKVLREEKMKMEQELEEARTKEQEALRKAEEASALAQHSEIEMMKHKRLVGFALLLDWPILHKQLSTLDVWITRSHKWTIKQQFSGGFDWNDPSPTSNCPRWMF
jgi:hypothetical protein